MNTIWKIDLARITTFKTRLITEATGVKQKVEGIMIFNFLFRTNVKYYVNQHAQRNGDHEVHTETCGYLKAAKSKEYVGEFSNCRDAIREAKKLYKTADGCYRCCRECHRR